MKLSNLHEGQDYSSRFSDKRDEVRTLEAKLERLKAELRGPPIPDNARWIKRAIARTERALGAARFELQELRELWDSTRSKLGE